MSENTIYCLRTFANHYILRDINTTHSTCAERSGLLSNSLFQTKFLLRVVYGKKSKIRCRLWEHIRTQLVLLDDGNPFIREHLLLN